MRSDVGKFLDNDNNSEDRMSIMKAAACTLMMSAIIVGTANAQKPKTFEEAKLLSARQDKPLLFEFFSVG